MTTKSGIDQENELLNESAAKETSLNLQIMDLENETKQVSSDGYENQIWNGFFNLFPSIALQLRHELDRVRNERDRMLQENSEIGRDKSDADAEKLRLKVRFYSRWYIAQFAED